jgi:hypothetical protein
MAEHYHDKADLAGADLVTVALPAGTVSIDAVLVRTLSTTDGAWRSQAPSARSETHDQHSNQQ